MHFQRQDTTIFQVEPSVGINARPALGGVCFFIQMRGRATQYGIGATPLFGGLQFNASGPALPWSVFELARGYAQPDTLRENVLEHLYYEGYLSYAQLEAFEKERNGKDFMVSVKASLRVLNQSGQIEDWFIQDSHLNKTAQEWLTVLGNAGYKRYLFQEMAFPIDAGSTPNSVYSHLCRARELFDKALYRECVSSLRLAQDLLRERRADKDLVDSATRRFKEAREEMTLEERMLFLRNSVQNALHTGPHHDVPSEAFNRETTKTLLMMVSALVELFPEPS